MITLFIKIISLSNNIENGRQMFHQLIEKYPEGTQPLDDVKLMLYYLFVKEEKCCGINTNKPLRFSEMTYFYMKFPSNCLVFELSDLNSKPRYQ